AQRSDAERARTQAEKWVGGLTALLGLLSVAGIVAGATTPQGSPRGPTLDRLRRSHARPRFGRGGGRASIGCGARGARAVQDGGMDAFDHVRMPDGRPR